MPQLVSRPDASGWVTPSPDDILESPATPPGRDETIRAQAMALQRALTEQVSPVRVMNVRPSNSRTLFLLRADNDNRFVKRDTLRLTDITRAFNKITQAQPSWSLAYLPTVQEPGVMGVLISTTHHQPLRLRQLLIRTNFRDHTSPLMLPLGMSLEQQLIMRDLAEIGQLLVLGEARERSQFIKSMLLSLLLFNTPGELRLALGGSSGVEYASLFETPHVLGRLIVHAREGQRLLDGLVKEVQRRQQWFRKLEVDDVETYNQRQKTTGARLPKIVFIIDSLSDPEWQPSLERLTPTLYDLALHGAATGIYLIVTSSANPSQPLPQLLQATFNQRLLLRPDNATLHQHLPILPESAFPFIDALYIEQGREIQATPIELAAPQDDELQRLARYWQRSQQVETPQAVLPTPARSGVTAMLTPLPDSALAGVVPETPRAELLARATQSLAGETDSKILRQSEALAAYLGWLGVGPLEDILGLSQEEARGIMTTLQSRGVLEEGNQPTPRFKRLVAASSQQRR